MMIPLPMAFWERDRQGHSLGVGQLRAHSDARAQYTALSYTERLALDSIAPSIGSVSDAYDNTLTETINSPLQNRVHPHHDLPQQPVQDHHRHQVHNRQIGQVAQQSQAPHQPRNNQPQPIRDYPLQDPHPKDSPHIQAASNPSRITLHAARCAATCSFAQIARPQLFRGVSVA